MGGKHLPAPAFVPDAPCSKGSAFHKVSVEVPGDFPLTEVELQVCRNAWPSIIGARAAAAASLVVTRATVAMRSVDSASDTGDAARVSRASCECVPFSSTRHVYRATTSSGASVAAPLTSARRRTTLACASVHPPSTSRVARSALASIPKSSVSASCGSFSDSTSPPSTRSVSRTARNE